MPGSRWAAFSDESDVYQSRMELLTRFLQETQRSVVDEVQNLVRDHRIKERILEEAQNCAQRIANHIQDPQRAAPLAPFDPVPIDSENDLNEYCLVLDYLESIGLKFAPTVFRYETQHPNQFANRVEIAQKLHLRSYDKTPLLVQMVEEKRKSLGKRD
jgi:hypothetical protein